MIRLQEVANRLQAQPRWGDFRVSRSQDRLGERTLDVRENAKTRAAFNPVRFGGA